MPTYSYACDACGGSFELEQRISEDPVKKCSLCGKPQAKRQIVSGNFILKGGGWYSDGYGSSKSGSTSGSSSSKVDKVDKVDKAPTKSESSSSASSTKSETKASAAE
jgi:putative FmdB family regulatory protein